MQELTDALGLPASTVRRDFEQLDVEGHVRRTHGGAVVSTATHSTFEPAAAIAAQASRADKSAIGRAASYAFAW